VRNGREAADSAREGRVPWYVRAGKCLPETATEIVVELKPPPQDLFADASPTRGPGNYVRFRLGPDAAIALAARTKRAGEEFIGDQHELFLLDILPNEESPYERQLGDALAGDGSLFTREDAVEAAWAIVDTVLAKHQRTHRYEPGTWGPEQADRLIGPDGPWHNPAP
jgi:glucose-6-phosphate 1-dehydrogenase